MSSEINRLQASDFEEALDMLNFSFGFQHPKNFETLLPALYKAEDEHMSWNWAVRENGRIRAIVGAFPLAWQLGETTLRISGIGGVSCHPRARNQGYMQQLMSHAVASMRAEGYHLSYLGGQRQRYLSTDPLASTCHESRAARKVKTIHGRESTLPPAPCPEQPCARVPMR